MTTCSNLRLVLWFLFGVATSAARSSITDGYSFLDRVKGPENKVCLLLEISLPPDLLEDDES